MRKLVALLNTIALTFSVLGAIAAKDFHTGVISIWGFMWRACLFWGLIYACTTTASKIEGGAKK